MSEKTIYWYDFETFGINPKRDRASQFAGIRTDEQLNIIGEPLMMYCKPADDFLPDPMACLITGISPQKAMSDGVIEAEFIKRIHQEFAKPGTCVAGYNSIRFDDEMTRQLLYRNFYDPYEREWKNGNSRWDIIDMVRLCAATRPEGINWPLKEDGSNSFKLDQLTVANNIAHADAHDALADVIATIEIAKLIKTRQPKLYDHIYKLRNKRVVQAEIDMVTRKPLLHVSMMYPATRGCLALVMPICEHPTNKNGVIVCDLREDPRTWLDYSVEQIRKAVYTPAKDMREGDVRVPLKTIHINKCPIVTSPAVLAADQAEKYGIDIALCKKHWEILQSNFAIVKKISAVFNEENFQKEIDPDFMIYSGGFFSEGDRSLMAMVRSASAIDLGRLGLPFKDSRLSEMLFRYRARNYKETLSNSELLDWEKFRQERLGNKFAQDKYKEGYTQAKLIAEQKEDAEYGALLERLDEYESSLAITSLQT
ncbi:MAG: exodeoxyribonuclease I [SAR86 cluster bacterium]|uniref:Exodeoxyribonuclease I n=1 Tax=SAR86 cluster bacterium TaxID=2030880 RepID=A0A2A5ASF0_9GAMM|nr:MAG: exodeoxyribonuclease I [SAR86 cluster bacterium]